MVSRFRRAAESRELTVAGPGRVVLRGALAVGAVMLVCAVAVAFPAGAAGEQASEPGSPAAGALDAGGYHSCAVLITGGLRCWGFNGDGQLGYGSTDTIGDDETPSSVGPVSFGAGHTVRAIAAGDFHTCALLDDGSVRCGGFGGNGRLGYGNTSSIRDPAAAGSVDLGLGHTATAITAGAAHTCALLDDGTVRCWGFGGDSGPIRDGRLGYGNTDNIGDDETPGSVGPVKLGRKAVAITAGGAHTCALLYDGTVRCWGRNDSGQLGYGNRNYIGDTATTTPDLAGPVKLGVGAMATAITAGGRHTCALLAGGSVRCWGEGGAGQLGYGNRNNIGDNETPDSVAPVMLGGSAVAITAGDAHTCAVLDDGSLRCWGLGASGRLGYGNQDNVGDDEAPNSVGPVDLGSARTAAAVTAGRDHTCARLDHGSVRCWGYGANGRLGYCNLNSIGDDETPGSVGPVSLESGDGGQACPSQPGAGPPSASTPSGATPGTAATKAAVIDADATRARRLRGCLAAVAAHAKRERRFARRGSARRRANARRHATRHARSARRHCLRIDARTPGQVTGLRALKRGKTEVELSFNAPGTDANHPPPARSYVVKQSRHPIQNARDFARAQSLCKGACRFTVPRLGAKVSLTITDLKPHTTYYYAAAARDNISAKRGPRSQTVKTRTA